MCSHPAIYNNSIKMLKKVSDVLDQKKLQEVYVQHYECNEKLFLKLYLRMWKGSTVLKEGLFVIIVVKTPFCCLTVSF